MMRGNVISIDQRRVSVAPNRDFRSTHPEKFVVTAAFRQMLESDSPIIILAAPAGYGKSSLLRAIAQKCSAEGRSCVWRGTDIGPTDRSLADVDVILVDDAHHASADRLLQIVRSVSSTNFHQRIFLATRTLPDANWLSLEATGRVEIFRPEVLAMNLAETQAMLGQYAGSQPSPGQVEQVWARTEGWPIAAQWYGMLAKQRGGWSSLAVGANKSRNDLGQYLNEMIYRELDEPLQHFLFDICDLELFQVDMLEDVMAQGGLAMLHRLRHENLLIQAAGDEAGHLRLHGLLQSFVARKQREVGRARNTQLLDRACQWCIDHGRYPEAVEYAIRADRLDDAHELLAEHCAEIINIRGELPGMLRWTDRLDRAGIALNPSLALWRVWALILAGELAKAECELEAIRAKLSPEMPNAIHLHAERLELSLATRRMAPEAIVALADTWLDEWGAQDPFHCAATYVMRAMAHHAQGQLLAAQRDLASARCAATNCDGVYARMWVVKTEAYLGLRSGRVISARDALLAAIDTVRDDGTVSMSTLGTLHLLISRIYVELLDFARAREHLSAGHLYIGDTGLIEMHLAATEAAVYLAEEESVDAALREIQAHTSRNLRSWVERDLSTVRLLLRNGRISEASAIFGVSFASESGGWQHVGLGTSIPGSLLTGVRVVHAQLLFALGKMAEAEAICRELLPQADTRGFMDEYLCLLFLAAACAHHEDRRSDARRLLIRTIRIAAERSTLHNAVIASWPVKAFLREYVDLDEGLRAEATSLLCAIRRRHGVEISGSSEDALLDSLTPRELEVLSMLDSGLTTDAIANRLNMGLSTVKWHIRNIYGKLGVRNRSGALVRSRRLGLIRDVAI